MKKLLKYLALIITIGLFALAGYFFVFKKNNLSDLKNLITNKQEQNNFTGENTSLVGASANINKPFGIVFPQDGSEFTKDMGVQHIRELTKWQDLEPTKGNYDFSELEAGIKLYQPQNIEIVITLVPCSEWGGFKKTNQNKKHCATGLPEDLNAWNKMFSTVVEKTDGDGFNDFKDLKYPINHFQVGNEFWAWEDTNENYVKLLKTSSEQIKNANPNAKVVLGALSGANVLAFSDNYINDREKIYVKTKNTYATREQISASPTTKNDKAQFEYILKNGRDYFDILDIHCYLTDPYEQTGTLDWFKNLAKANGALKPIFMTEGTSPRGPNYTRAKHAAYLLEQNLFAMLSGVEKFDMWVLFAIPDQDEDVNRMAFIDEKDHKTPAYYTYKLMTEKLGGMTKITQIGDAKDVYVFELTDGQKKVYVAWSIKGKGKFEISLKSNATITHIITKENQTTPKTEILKSSNGKLKLELTEEPIFIEAN